MPALGPAEPPTSTSRPLWRGTGGSTVKLAEQKSVHNYYPAFLDLRDKPVVVVGGGEVAFRKIESLLAAGARVKVVAPQLHVGVEALLQRNEVVVERREYATGDLDGAMLVIAAASLPEVNHQVAADAAARGLFVNVVDDPSFCNFIVPSVIRRDELTLAISTGGLSPALAKRVRQKLEETLVPEYGGFLRMLGTLRARVRAELPLSAQREAFWSEVVNSDAFDRFRAKGEEAALGRIEEILQRIRDGEPCTVVAVGLNHRTAPVEIRELFAVGSEATGLLLEDLAEMARERVVISTCNRTEVYAVPHQPRQAGPELRGLLRRIFCPDLAQSQVDPHLYALHNEVAARHLFSVAAGIDSMILGEPQILGQVRDAFELAAERGATGPILSNLFQRAVATGKRARTETDISRNAVSVSHVAVEMARDIFGDISTRTVLVVGAGEMAELAAKNLLDNGVRSLLVINRTWEKAVGLAERFGGTALAWESMVEALAQADIVITSTGAPRPIFQRELVETAMANRRRRPLFLIDIAVPRDVDPAVGKLDSVFLYDIDDLQSVVEANLRERESEIPRVQAIVEEEVRGFVEWLRCQEVVPTIVALRDRMERIRKAELARYSPRLDLSDRDRKTLDALTQAIVNKVLHTPTIRLKSQANDGSCGTYVDAVKELFDLETT